MSNPLSFTPVPRQRNRHDGWTADAQRTFIDALSEFGTVGAAARKAGMNPASAYRLRDADGAESFAGAWDRALKIGAASLADIAMDRAINGVAVPVFYKGEQVGERRWFDNRLLMFMMRQTLSRRFGPYAAEYDFVDETLAAERARDEKRGRALVEAQQLLGAINEFLAEAEAEAEAQGQNFPTQLDDLYERRDRLSDLVAQLMPADPVQQVPFLKVDPIDLLPTRRRNAALRKRAGG